MGSGANALIKILVIGNGMTMLTFGLGLLLVKNGSRARIWGAFFFLSTAAAFIVAMAEASGLYRRYPHILLVEFACLSLSGPSLYGFLARLVAPETPTGIRSYAPFGFSAAYLAAMLPFFALPGSSKVAVYDAILAGELRPYIAFLILTPSVLVAACAAAFLAWLFRRARAERRAPAGSERSVALLAALIAASALAHAASLAMDAPNGPLFLVATFSILLAMLFVLRRPALLLGRTSAERGRGRGRSKLAGVDLRAMRARVAGLMECDKPYLDETLSLESLSGMLGLTQHQLSEFLNKEMGASFKAYVNDWRVREAKRRIADDSPESMLDLALECGFNSKSNFNKVFKEATGVTPSEYGARLRER